MKPSLEGKSSNPRESLGLLIISDNHWKNPPYIFQKCFRNPQRALESSEESRVVGFHKDSLRVRNPHTFLRILQDFSRFFKILKDSSRFQRLMNVSINLKKLIQRNNRLNPRFPRILRNSLGFLWDSRWPPSRIRCYCGISSWNFTRFDLSNYLAIGGKGKSKASVAVSYFNPIATIEINVKRCQFGRIQLDSDVNIQTTWSGNITVIIHRLSQPINSFN